MATNDDNRPVSKINISSGWTALTSDPFSQIDASTFTMITEHSTISKKSIYNHNTLFTSEPSSSAPLITNILQQLIDQPTQSYHIIKQAFKNAQIQNVPENWSQFYTAMERFTIDSHDPVAVVHLAMCLISGLGCTTDEQRGFDLLKSHPSCESDYVLGHCYLSGLPVSSPHTLQPVDHFIAFEYFKKAAHEYELINDSVKATVAEAQCRLARMYFQGHGVQQNSKEGLNYLMKSAQNHNRYAQFLMGVHYECGLEIPQDLKMAKQYYESSAHQEFPDAQAALGNQYIIEKEYEQGVKWLEKSIQKGNSRAHVQLGLLYDKGIGVDQNDKLALDHYKIAVEKNNRSAQYLLGLVYYFGRLGECRDMDKATRLIQQAATAGYPYAQRVLGQFYQHTLVSSNIQHDDHEAVCWYKRAAINNDMTALNLLGRCYQHGIGVEVDLKKSLAYYTKAAERQDSPYIYYAKIDQALLLQRMSQHVDAFQLYSHILSHGDPDHDKEPIELATLSLGRYHLRSDIQGIPHNPALSFQLWTELAKTTRSPDVFYWLGSCYDEGIPDICEINQVKALSLFTTAADLGDVDSMFTIASMMSNHRVAHKGPADAFPWYQKAAQNGHAGAMYALGLCYHKGIGMEQPQIDTALDWLERASKQGMTDAMSYCAKLYLQLRETHPENQYSAQAVKWLKRAAERQDVYAQRELGKIYLSGQGLATDHTKAFQLLQKAALKQDPEAMAFLGSCYQKGTGVEKSLDLALECYLKSVSMGYVFAYSAVAELHYERGNFESAYEFYLLASKVSSISHSKTGMAARWMVARLVIGYIPTDNQKTLRSLESAIQSDSSNTTSIDEAFKMLYALAVEDQYELAFEPLGYCYMNGLGIELDLIKAQVWIQMAVKKSTNGTAYFRLYEIYNRNSDIPLALQCLRQSAEMGYAVAQFNMGLIYLRGEFGILSDERLATEWFKHAASQLYPPSIWMLSQMAGSIGQDELKWQYQKNAASLGHVLSMRELGQNYLEKQASADSDICIKNECLDMALHYLHMAADADDIEALILLGKTYISCTKTLLRVSSPKSPKEDHLVEEDYDSRWQSEEDERSLAIQCFEKASDLGSLEATVCAAEAWHEQQQYAAAFDHFEKAATQGHVLARFFCALYTLEGLGGVLVDHEKGFKTLAQCYENGVGVQKNDSLAYKWYCRAANVNSDSEAYYRIGLMFSQRRVQNKMINSDMEAFRIYQQATMVSPKSHGLSCYALGIYFLKGIPDPKTGRFLLIPDMASSIDYFRTASDLGIKEAMTELGVLLLKDNRSQEEQEEGLYRLKLAADMGYPEAQFQLGLLYYYGRTEGQHILVSQALDTAYDLFCRSAASNHPSSVYYVALYYHHGIVAAADLDMAIRHYQAAITLFKTAVCDERWQAEYNLANLLHPDMDAYTLFQAACAHSPEDEKYLSQIMIARYHLHGWEGVTKTENEAAAFFIDLAHKRYEQVYLDVAQCYEMGLGVKQDYAEAFYWYGEVLDKEEEEANEQAIALLKIAEFYKQGNVVNTDLEKSKTLYSIAVGLSEGECGV